MGFFDFLKRDKIPADPAELIQKRWVHHEDGTIRDSLRTQAPDNASAIFSVRGFEFWFHGLEQRLGQSLGRRLAHSALEHEEFMLNTAGLAAPSGRDLSNWADSQRDWQSRGLGRYSSLEDDESTRILIEHPASSAICAGLITASWERATGQRHKFVWSQNAQEGLVVSLEPDHLESPAPNEMPIPWRDSNPGLTDLDRIELAWEDLRIESNSVWSNLQERRMVIHRDLILRFEEFCIPYLDGIKDGRKNMVWPLEDEQRIAWWTAAADSMRQSVFESGIHILVSQPEDWLNISSRHLGLHGLGKVESASQSDSQGGVELTLNGCFHPALAGGVLLACWERAYGRRGHLKCTFNSGAVRLSVGSAVTLAE